MERHSLWAVACGLALLLTRQAPAANPISAKSPGGDRVASASDKVIQVFDQKTNKLLMKMAAHKADIQALIYAPDGKLLASADKDGVVNMFDAATGKTVWSVKSLPGVNVLSFSADGKKLTAKAPAGKQTFSIATGKKVE